MSRLITSVLMTGLLAAAGATLAPTLSVAADLQALPLAHEATRYCGTCGCLQVSHVRHRELRSTYGIAFDPRNYDTTEPHYYFGPIRTYPRYWACADVR
jgi:hypothetical protein